MAFNPNKSPNPKPHRHQRGLSLSKYSTNSAMESHCFMSTKEYDENRRIFANDFDSSTPMDFANSENKRVLGERNLNYFAAPKERKSPNSEIDFGSALFGDSPKPSRIQLEVETEYQCEMGSIFKSNSNSNSAKARRFQNRSNFTQNEKFDSDFEFNSEIGETREMGFTPMHRVSSIGNLAESESKFEFGSNQRRSASPKLRRNPNHEIGFYSPSFRDKSRRKSNDFGCNCELVPSKSEFQSPIFGSFHSPIYDSKSNYLSPKPPFLRNRSKSELRNSLFSSQFLQQKSNIDSLSKNLEKKVTVPSETKRPISSKSNFCLSKLIKIIILLGFFIVGFLFVKDVSFLSSNLGSNLFLKKNLADLSLNPEYLGDFPNFNEEIKNRDLNMDQEIEIFDLNQNSEEKNEKAVSFNHEMEENVESLVLNNPILLEEETPITLENEDIYEQNKEKDNPTEEKNNIFEEIESELGENEINSEKTEQKEPQKELEMENNSKTGIASSCFISVPVQTGTKEKEENSKDALRIGFSVAFICVAICASLISCFIKREQFGEILKRNCSYSSIDGKKRAKKRSRDDNVLSNEGSYGSFLTYEKIPIKKRIGDEGLMTPVRRSSRIRNHFASP